MNKKVGIRVNIPSLRKSNPVIILGKIQAVKISFKQAMLFKGNFKTFAQMLERYGRNSELRQDERYIGYLAVYTPFGQMVAWVDEASRYLEVINFNMLDFESHIRIMKSFGYLWRSKEATKIATSIRTKIFIGVIKDVPISVSKDEFLVLKTYFGDKKFKKIFRIV